MTATYGSRHAGRLGTLAMLVVLVMMNRAAPQLPGEADNKVLVDGDSGSEAATHKARILISVSQQCASYMLHACWNKDTSRYSQERKRLELYTVSFLLQRKETQLLPNSCIVVCASSLNTFLWS